MTAEVGAPRALAAVPAWLFGVVAVLLLGGALAAIALLTGPTVPERTRLAGAGDRPALAQYRAPGSYAPLLEQLSRAGRAQAPAVDSAELEAALLRLGDYLVSTAAYAVLAELGRPVSDPGRIGALLHELAVAAVLATPELGLWLLPNPRQEPG